MPVNEHHGLARATHFIFESNAVDRSAIHLHSLTAFPTDISMEGLILLYQCVTRRHMLVLGRRHMAQRRSFMAL